MSFVTDKDNAFVVFDTAHGTIDTNENRELRVLEIGGLSQPPASFQTVENPYIPGEVMISSHYSARIITVEITAPREYRGQLIKQFASGEKGRMTVVWGENMRYIDYVVQDAEVAQATIARDIRLFLKLRCPDVFFNDMHDFGENIAAIVPLIIFPNLWYIGDNLMSDFKRHESAVALENAGDVPIGLKFSVRAATHAVLNPVIYLSEDVFFRVNVRMQPNDVLDISTVRREKQVLLNGVNILNQTDMRSTFFEIAPGRHTIYYGAEDGAENIEVFLYRRPQYWGV